MLHVHRSNIYVCVLKIVPAPVVHYRLPRAEERKYVESKYTAAGVNGGI
jgi:hypothetical protein